MYSTFMVGTCQRYLVSLDEEISVGDGTIIFELVEKNGHVRWVMVTLRKLADLVFNNEEIPHFAMNKVAGVEVEKAVGAVRAMAV